MINLEQRTKPIKLLTIVKDTIYSTIKDIADVYDHRRGERYLARLRKAGM